MNVMASPEYFQNLLWLLMENDEVTTGNGITWRKMSDMEHNFRLRAIVPMKDITDEIRMNVWMLMTNLLETMLSETTNNDACRVEVIETSAHFEAVPDGAEFNKMPFGSVIVYDGHILDWLS